MSNQLTSLVRRRLLKRLTACALGGIAVGSSWRRPAHAHGNDLVGQTIPISMQDGIEGKPAYFFEISGQVNEKAAIEVQTGELIRFAFENRGSLIHNAHFGRDPDLDGLVYRENLISPCGMLELLPGRQGMVSMTFAEDHLGDWEIGCLQAEPYEAGMRIPLSIKAPGVFIDLRAGAPLGWDPDEIHVKLGDMVTLRMSSTDGDDHTFLLLSWDIEEPIYGGLPPQEFSFIADKPGTHPFVCGNAYCEAHKTMLGKLIVEE